MKFIVNLVVEVLAFVLPKSTRMGKMFRDISLVDQKIRLDELYTMAGSQLDQEMSLEERHRNLRRRRRIHRLPKEFDWATI